MAAVLKTAVPERVSGVRIPLPPPARLATGANPGRHTNCCARLAGAMVIAIDNGYNLRMKVSVAEAKNALPRLIKAVEDGESVTICRHGTPVADIVRTMKADPDKPTFGTLKGKVIAHDPDWWKPMTEVEAEALLDGR